MAESLSSKTKLAVIAVVILVSLGVVYLPQIVKGDVIKGDTGPAKKITRFQVTPKPQEAYGRALKGDRPIFLEFYAKW